MKAEIISIGDEMTSGQRLDTNSRWLSQQLADLGVITLRHTTVADDMQANIECFASAARRADLVISTGGLGPTLDDLTRDALAAAFDAPLELDPESLKHIEEMFAQRRRSMPERNRAQAYRPRGSLIIPNPHGTAPGIDITVDRPGSNSSRVFALPGVPAEMIEMWNGTVRGRILDALGPTRRPLRFHTIKVFGIGESDAEVLLPELMRRDREPLVGITVSRATISLRIAASAESEEHFARVIAPTVAEIQKALGVLIFGSGEDELEHALLRQLRSLGARLAVLEIGPASLLANWLMCASADDPPGTVSVLSCASIDQAARTLARLQPHDSNNSRSELTSLSTMAQCIRSLFETQYALVVATYASPSDLLQTKPTAEVRVAIAGPNLPTSVKERTLIGHPDILNDRVAKTALDTLRLAMLHQNE